MGTREMLSEGNGHVAARSQKRKKKKRGKEMAKSRLERHVRTYGMAGI